jgi:tetratricopeptide (TPR) repeat protein
LALLLESRQELGEAEKLYLRLLECYPEAQDAWFRQGYLRLQRGDLPGCKKAFESCLIFQQKNPDVLLNLGIAHWRMRNLEQARETFRQIPISSPQAAEALRCLAAIALECQDFEQALALHVQLLELGEPSAELLYNTGLLLQKLGQAAEAVSYYRQALAYRPDFPEALLNLGHALMALGKHEDAHSSWQAALRGNVALAEHFLV